MLLIISIIFDGRNELVGGACVVVDANRTCNGVVVDGANVVVVFVVVDNVVVDGKIVVGRDFCAHRTAADDDDCSTMGRLLK